MPSASCAIRAPRRHREFRRREARRTAATQRSRARGRSAVERTERRAALPRGVKRATSTLQRNLRAWWRARAEGAIGHRTRISSKC